MGLSQLDAEGVIWFSQAYGGTSESQSATKKPHKIMKSVEFFDGFLHLKTNNNIFSNFLFLALCVAFVLRLMRQSLVLR